jgi:hypothetical protein
VLRAARDSSGRSPEDWLASSLASCAGPLVELTSALESTGQRIRVRRAEGHSASAALTDPTALPIGTNAVGAVRVTMCLQTVDALDGLFGELRRIMRPAATLAALLPARPALSLPELRAWRPVRRALGGYFEPRHSSARNHPGWLLAAADFAILVDQRRLFWVPLPDEQSAIAVLAGLTTAGVLAADIPPAPLDRARATLVQHARPDRRMPIPLRLLVGRR